VHHIVYSFDRFQLDVTRRKLVSSGGIVLPLKSRPMEALLLLVANAGQIVERRRLMETVWPDRIVEDNNLNQCVLAIRKALGEAAGSNSFVMTVPGRGFCFVCPVRVRTQESSDDTRLSAAPSLEATVQLATPAVAVNMPAPRKPEVPRHRLALSAPFWIGMALGGAFVALLLLPFAMH
jgi:DNA-binding winged helix-turn-helix (wHTH) protein